MFGELRQLSRAVLSNDPAPGLLSRQRTRLIAALRGMVAGFGVGLPELWRGPSVGWKTAKPRAT
ncbi:hypothetical protein [Aestuariivita sp.]|jgi:hypothetical protein|uniref:hypothetical protein n=1 Tax=Aestuariivita sp. TaxID=1872407 RepID=UPI0021732B05|nr:hypothetical protein [Aestuariivita sp.]MCE8005647.1 hypothetical protein [Aestuariivita sp.]